jgi:hypothetical protein
MIQEAERKSESFNLWCFRLFSEIPESTRRLFTWIHSHPALLAALTWQAGILLINKSDEFKTLRNPLVCRCHFTAMDLTRGILFADNIWSIGVKIEVK